MSEHTAHPGADMTTRQETTMRIIIHDLNTGTVYTANSPDDCKDSTDRSAFELARDLGQTITMGKVIAKPA